MQKVCILFIVLLLIVIPIGICCGSTDDGNTDDTSHLIPVANQYAYITVESMDIELKGVNALITINYNIEPWIEFIVFLFGNQNLKERLMRIINYPDQEKSMDIDFQYVDNHKAVISVKDVSFDYKDGGCWYLAHTFGVSIPKLVFISPGMDDRVYTNIKKLERGFGYYLRF